MRALLVAALVFSAAFAGCARPLGFSPDACPLRVLSAEWVEPGAAQALHEAKAAGRARLVPQPRLMEVALPADRLAPAWDGYGLTYLEWMPPDMGALSLRPELPGAYVVDLREFGHDELALGPFGAFLEQLGLADAPERAAWERAFLATAQKGATMHVTVHAEPDLTALLDAALAGEPEVVSENGRSVMLRWGDWRLALHAPQWQVEDKAAGVTMLVDAHDRVWAWAQLPPEDASLETMRARMNATFAGFGLAAPAFEGVRAQPPHCSWPAPSL